MRTALPLRLEIALALSIIISSTTAAIAQPAVNKVLAQQLFEQGRDLMKINKWTEACPKFEASLRYDAAAMGTLLNLATCYEKIGRLASAWLSFRDAADLALQVGDTVRREHALKQVAALLPRLPRLTIAGPSTPLSPGFTVTRDGIAFDLAALGSALSVDPGPHEVTASAPGFEPFKAMITVDEGKSETVVIRELVPLKTPAVEPQLPSTTTAPEEDSGTLVERSEPGRRRKLVGIGLAGGGAVLTSVGFFLGVRASSIFNDAKTLCGTHLICGSDADYEQGKDLIDQARTRATVSTVLVITGVAAAAAGAVVWVTASKREGAETAVVPVVADRDLGLAIVGRF